LELDSITKWVWWVSVSNSVNVPALVGTVMALPPDDVSVMGVVVSVNIEALVPGVSDISS